MNRSKFSVDYYIKEKSTDKNTYDEYNITDKIKFDVVSSTGSLEEDDFDVFIRKSDFPEHKSPSPHDLAFFIKELKFYDVKDCQDAGDFYIINITKYKCK